MIRFREDPYYSSPFEEIKKLKTEMNRMFNSYFGTETAFPVSGVFPTVNVSEDEGNMYVRAELPGVESKDIDISLEGGTLTIRGGRKTVPEKKEISYHRREREAGTFRRSISLPVRVDTEKVTAESKDGVLKITLPKAAEAKPKKIDIASG